MKKIALSILAAAAATLGVGMVASAQNYDDTVEVSPVTPGGGYEATYRNCVVGETITFTQPESTPPTVTATCESVAASLGGSIVGLLVPAQATFGTAVGSFDAGPTAPGTYTLTAVGEQSPQIVTQFTVTAAGTTPPATTPTGGLPATGASGAGSLTWIAVGLFGVGTGLLVVAQVRRRQTRLA